MKTEERRTNGTERTDATDGPQEWWAGLPRGERHLIWSVMKLLRGAKRSEVAEVARAAAKWERGIGCFIKLRLMSARPRGRAVESGWLRVEGRGAARTSNIQHSTSNIECGEGRKGMGRIGQRGQMVKNAETLKPERLKWEYLGATGLRS